MFGTMRRMRESGPLSLPYSYSPALSPQLLLQHSLWSRGLSSSPSEPSCQLSSEDFPKHTTSIRKCKAAILCLNGSSLCPFPLLFLLDIQIFLIFSQNSSPASSINPFQPPQHTRIPCSELFEHLVGITHFSTYVCSSCQSRKLPLVIFNPNTPFYGWGYWGPRKSCDMPRVTLLSKIFVHFLHAAILYLHCFL